VRRAIAEGRLRHGEGRYACFFFKNAENALDCAALLLRKTEEGVLDGSLWVVNASYYAMFFAARGALENVDVLLSGEESRHLLVIDAFLHHFFVSGVLERSLSGSRDAHALAFQLVDEYLAERSKRHALTYELGREAMLANARTSLERARRFVENVRAARSGNA